MTVDVSDYKLQELLKLALSIPVPESSKEPEEKFSRVSQHLSSKEISFIWVEVALLNNVDGICFLVFGIMYLVSSI